METGSAVIRPVSRNAEPGEESGGGDKILSRLNSIIDALQKIRFIRALEYLEKRSSAVSSSLKRLDSAIDVLRKVRFLRQLEKIGYH